MPVPTSYKALCDKMGALYQEMQQIVDSSNGSADGMAPEMEAKFSALKTQYASLRAQRQRNEELMAMDNGQQAVFSDIPAAPEVRGAQRAERPAKVGERRETDEYRDAFHNYLRNGEHTAPAELRALTEASGGTVIPPTEFDNQLVAKLQTMTSVRNLARKLSLGSFAREVAFENATGAAYWVGESTAPTEAAPTFSKITLTPKRLSALLRVSNELVADADARGGNMSISSIVTEQMARVFAQTEETALLAASNVSGAPASLLNDAALTSSTTGSYTAFTAEKIIDWIYSLPRQYRQHPSCAIIVNDSTLGYLRKLGGVGGASNITNYFWENGYTKGGSGAAPEPDRILGIPVYTSAAISALPTSGTTATKIGIIGAWDYCYFGTTGNYELKVLRERYADTNETGYIANMRMDCQLSLPALAFKGLVTSAS